MLEVDHSGTLIRLPSSATNEDFVAAASRGDAVRAAAVLLSLVVQSGGLKQVAVSCLDI